MITDEMAARALHAAWDAGANEGSLNEFEMRAALAAVADELAERGAAKERERCGVELHAALTAYPYIGKTLRRVYDLADDWAEAAS